MMKQFLAMVLLFQALPGGPLRADAPTLRGTKDLREEARAWAEVRRVFQLTQQDCMDYYATKAGVFQEARRPRVTMKAWENLREPIGKLSPQHRAEAAVLYFFGIPLEGEKQATYMALFFGGITREKIDQKLVAVLDAVPEKDYAEFCREMGYSHRKAAYFKSVLKMMREMPPSK